MESVKLGIKWNTWPDILTL